MRYGIPSRFVGVSYELSAGTPIYIPAGFQLCRWQMGLQMTPEPPRIGSYQLVFQILQGHRIQLKKAGHTFAVRHGICLAFCRETSVVSTRQGNSSALTASDKIATKGKDSHAPNKTPVLNAFFPVTRPNGAPAVTNRIARRI